MPGLFLQCFTEISDENNRVKHNCCLNFPTTLSHGTWLCLNGIKSHPIWFQGTESRLGGKALCGKSVSAGPM